MFNPAQNYDQKISLGANRIFKESEDEYKTRREESIAPEKEYKVIMSPSRASFFLDMGDNVKTFQGECHRHAFMNMKRWPSTNEPGAFSIRRMLYGKEFEAIEHTFEDKAGILEKKNFRMNKEISPDVLLSCEVDSIVKLTDNKPYIVEIKSYDGYYSVKKIQGNKSREGMPKYDHIAQNMFYLAITPEHYPEIDTTIFHYRRRSDMHPTYHILTLDMVKDSTGRITDAFPVINGKKRTFISLKDLITRGLLLANYIIEDRLPPRDPEYSYSEEKVRYLLSIDEVPKSTYKDWQEGQAIVGDWQCKAQYCRYHNLCLGCTPQDKSSWPSDEEIMAKLNQHTVEKSDDLDSAW